MISRPMAHLAPALRMTASTAVAGVGVYLPPDSAALAPQISGADCTGVSNRVEAQQGVSTPSLAAGAARAALRAAAVPPGDIEMIVVGTTSPDVLWPSTACLVQVELGLPMVASFDLYAAEAGLLTALSVAHHYVASGAAAALVIGAESDNQLVDLSRQSHLRYGRGASAVVLQRTADAGDILATVVGGGGTADSNAAGREQALVHGLSSAVKQCLAKARLDLADVDLVIAEQTAPEIMEVWAQAQGLSRDRLLLEPDRYASAFAAAPLVALHDAVKNGRLRPGSIALLVSCGTGPAWAVVCLRWGKGAVASW